MPACVSDAGLPSPGDFANAPTCTPGTCILAGSLAGAPVQQSYTLAAFDYANGISFTADFGTGGHIALYTTNVLLPGQADGAAGPLLTPKEGPLPGSNLCFGDGTRLQYVDDSGHVEIRFIGRCITGSCGGDGAAPVAGEIDGCCEK
jgi:hypothetical protein